MARATPAIYHFNRGIISRLALARADLKRTAFSAEIMTNWIPRVLGSMMLRPGLQYLGSINSTPVILPFVFGTDDTALIELTDAAMRVWASDQLVTRVSVGTTIANGNFDSDLSSWTQDDEAGATSSWAAPGYMQLLGTGTAAAIREQQVTIATADQNTEHALRIVIQRGPVTLRVGSTSGGDDYISETDLETGAHSLAFVPTGAAVYVRLQSRANRITLVDSVNVESAGAMQLPSPWAGTDLQRVRFDQSADVLFVACKNFQQRRIERRSGRSWSIVLYKTADGPFRTENTGPITLATSALNGNVTLTASAAYFKSTQVGALIQIRSTGQRVSSNIAAQNTFTNTVRVVGVGEERRYTWEISGTWSGTVTLQRSVGTVGFWEDVSQKTSNASNSDNDGLDNQVVYYRLGFKTGDYVSGTATCTITYTLGSITGVARITDFTNNTTVGAEVLTDFGGTDASLYWSEASWSDRRGWPTAGAFYEGRLWWAGKNGIWGSVSDAFDSFDASVVGDSGPINRTIGSGPVDDINFILALQRLILGAQGAEKSVRSTTFDEPLTPTNFNIKDASTQGSAAVAAVKVDSRGLFVQRNGVRVYELSFDTSSFDYASTDLTALVPDLCSPGIKKIAVQRQPDTRIHCVLTNGTAIVGVIDRVENVLAWQLVETDGAIEDAVVLPGAAGSFEDSVYYVVQRTIGATGLSALAVTPGSGYTVRPTLVFTGGGGSNAAATIDLALVSATVAAGGANYAVNDVLTLTGGTKTASAQVRVLTVDGGGAVLTALVISGGDYTVLPANAVATTGGSGNGACTLTASWGLSAATITGTGGGYSSAPAVSVVDNGAGVGGAVVATVAAASQTGHYLEKWALESECVGGALNKQADAFVIRDTVAGGGPTAVVLQTGFVSSVTTTPGSNYSSPPTVNFASDSGSGAAARAYLGFNFIGSAVGAGSGYSIGDTVTFSGGTFVRPTVFRVTAIAGPNVVMTLVDAGQYSVVPPTTLIGGSSVISTTSQTGSGVHFSPRWGVTAISLTSGGSGYTSPPVVTLVGGGGSGAAATAAITATTVTTPGSDAVVSVGGLDHLEGKQVIAWADGIDLSPEDSNGVQTTYTVSGGRIGLTVEVSRAVVGLPYQADWMSSKLATLIPSQDSPLEQRKKIAQVGLLLVNTHIRGIKFGEANGGQPAELDNLPQVEAGQMFSKDFVYGEYDADMIEFPGTWGTDNRLWLRANAPRPCTVLGAVVAMEEHGKS